MFLNRFLQHFEFHYSRGSFHFQIMPHYYIYSFICVSVFQFHYKFAKTFFEMAKKNERKITISVIWIEYRAFFHFSENM